MRELSPVEFCKKKRWKLGDVIKRTEIDMGYEYITYWRITAFGENEVLGIQTDLKEYETSGEVILHFCSNQCTWRKVKAL